MTPIRLRSIHPFTIWFLFIWSCTPQPIYQSIKKTGESTQNVSKNTGWFGSDSSKTSSKTNSQQAVTMAAAVPLSAGALTKDKQDAMMSEIRSWIGTPYKFGMIEKGKGTDCSGFVGSVYKKVLNIDLPRQSADMYATGESVAQKDLKFGDLVFFQNTYKGAKGASHVGIYVGEDKIAHASTTVGVTISDLSEDYYKKHYLGCRKILKN